MCDKDGKVDNEKQYTCEGDNHHITAIPQGSAIQRLNSRHARGHNKTLWEQIFHSGQ